LRESLCGRGRGRDKREGGQGREKGKSRERDRGKKGKGRMGIGREEMGGTSATSNFFQALRMYYTVYTV